MERSYERGIFFISVSSVSVSVFSLFIKLSSENQSFFFLTFLRFLVPFLLMLPLVLWRGFEIKGFFSHIKGQLPRCLCILVSQYALFYYLTQGTLLNAAVLMGTAPLFMPLLERLFYQHPISRSTWVGVIVSLIGMICVLQPDQQIFSLLSLVGIVAGLGQAGSQVFYSRSVREERNDINGLYLFFLSALISFIPLMMLDLFIDHDFYQLFETLHAAGSKIWIYLLIIGIASIANQVFRGLAYLHARPSSLAPFFYIALIFSGFFDWAIFNVIPNALSFIGALLVILGGTLKLLLRRPA